MIVHPLKNRKVLIHFHINDLFSTVINFEYLISLSFVINVKFNCVMLFFYFIDPKNWHSVICVNGNSSFRGADPGHQHFDWEWIPIICNHSDNQSSSFIDNVNQYFIILTWIQSKVLNNEWFNLAPRIFREKILNFDIFEKSDRKNHVRVDLIDIHTIMPNCCKN